MFDDIFKECESLYVPEKIIETVSELRFKHKEIMFNESVDYILNNMMGSFLTEAVENDNKSFIYKLITTFKKLITKIKDWFVDKIFPMEKRLSKMIDILSTRDYSTIEIEAPKNINNLSSVIDMCKSASEELKTFQVDKLLSTLKDQNVFQKASNVHQILKGTFLNL